MNKNEIILAAGTRHANQIHDVLQGNTHLITAFIGVTIATLFEKLGDEEGAHMLLHLDELFDSLLATDDNTQEQPQELTLEDILNLFRGGVQG